MGKKFELGVHTGQQDVSLEELRNLWRHCDAAGVGLISIWDHFYESPPRDGSGVCYESTALLGTLAADTSRARIACLVFGVTYRNPGMLAKSMTTVDHLSNGRLTVGVGAGWHVPEHEGYGFELPAAKERLDRVSEGVRVLRAMFTSDAANFEGNYYHLKNARNVPQPVQARIPIIVGGGGEQRTTAIAARWADGTNQGYMPPEAYKHKNEVLDQWCEKFGRDPATLERSIILHFYMSSTGKSPGAQPDGGLHGSAQQVVDRLGQYKEAGAERVSLAIRPPVDWEALQTFIDKVMPAFE